MARYVIALLRGGQNDHGITLKPETLRLMLEPHYQLDEHLPAMGLAFILDNFDGHRIAWHNGGWPGFASAMFVAPEAGLGVVAFSNTLGFSDTSLAPDNIARNLLRRMLDVPDPASRLPRPNILESPHLWPDLCGFYGPRPGPNTNARIWMGFGGEVEIFVKGKHLALRPLIGPLRKGLILHPVDAGNPLVFQAVYEGEVQSAVFKRNAAGHVDRLCLGFNTFYKRPKMQSLRFRLMASLAGVAGLVVATLGRRKLKHRAKAG
jgi:hypothetical protein